MGRGLTKPPAGFEALMAEAEARPLVGWDLGYDGRITSAPPWDFDAIVDAHAATSPDLLDIGTGGGEWLSRRRRPPRTLAVEGWPPNVAVARRRLEPLRVAVLAVEPAPPNLEQDAAPNVLNGRLPFPDASFHLVTSRHEAYLPAEVARILAPGGTFLTQQVGSSAADDFHRLFDRHAPAAPTPGWTLAYAVRQLEAAGLTLEDAAEGFETMTFADVGALAWSLANMPFVDPQFAVPAARPALERLHRQAQPLTIRQPLFRLQARKPNR